MINVDEEFIRRRQGHDYRELIRWSTLEQNDVCLDTDVKLWGGITLNKGDKVEISMKGRSVKDLIIGVFECFNPYYATLTIKTKKHRVGIKLRDIKTISVESANGFSEGSKQSDAVKDINDEKVITEEDIEKAEGVRDTLDGNA